MCKRSVRESQISLQREEWGSASVTGRSRWTSCGDRFDGLPPSPRKHVRKGGEPCLLLRKALLAALGGGRQIEIDIVLVHQRRAGVNKNGIRREGVDAVVLGHLLRWIVEDF